MKGRLAGLLLLAVCLVLAVLLVTAVISPMASGAIFAAALALLGAFSGGFRRR